MYLQTLLLNCQNQFQKTILLILMKNLWNKKEAQHSVLCPIVFYLWQNWKEEFLKMLIINHGEEKLKDFLEALVEIHSTINCIAEWLQKSVNFLDIIVSLIDGQTETDLDVKPIDSHQYLQSSLCHLYHCEKMAKWKRLLKSLSARMFLKQVIN